MIAAMTTNRLFRAPMTFVRAFLYVSAAFLSISADVLSQTIAAPNRPFLQPVVGLSVVSDDAPYSAVGKRLGSRSVGFEAGFATSPRWSWVFSFETARHTLLNDDGRERNRLYMLELSPRLHTVKAVGGRITLRSGFHATFGDDVRTWGPLFGVGLDRPINDRMTFRIEAVSRLLLPDDAVDARSRGVPFDFVSSVRSGIQINIGPSCIDPPIANAIIPRRAMLNESVNFEASGSGGMRRYRWRFSDGREYNVPSFTRRFDKPGSYKVTLRIDGCRTSKVIDTVVEVFDPCTEPVRLTSVTVQPANIEIGQPVEFSARATGTAPISFRWTLAGEAGIMVNSPQFSHTFTTAGDFPVALEVSNCGHAVVNEYLLVRVDPPLTPPPVFFEHNSCTIADPPIFDNSILHSLRDSLTSNRSTLLFLVGRADETNAEYNEALSWLRAFAIADTLIALLPEFRDRIVAIGVGVSGASGQCTTASDPECKRQRRVSFELVSSVEMRKELINQISDADHAPPAALPECPATKTDLMKRSVVSERL